MKFELANYSVTAQYVCHYATMSTPVNDGFTMKSLCIVFFRVIDPKSQGPAPIFIEA